MHSDLKVKSTLRMKELIGLTNILKASELPNSEKESYDVDIQELQTPKESLAPKGDAEMIDLTVRIFKRKCFHYIPLNPSKNNAIVPFCCFYPPKAAQCLTTSTKGPM